MDSDTQLMNLLQEYNRIHLELVRVLRMRFQRPSDVSANEVRPSIGTPERIQDGSTARGGSRGLGRTDLSPIGRTEVSPLGRQVRVREDWQTEETELFVDLIASYPNRPPAFYCRKLGQHGYNKSLPAIVNKIKNLEQSARASSRFHDRDLDEELEFE